MSQVYEKITAILNWAEDYPTFGFDTEFVESLKEQYQDRGRLTWKQEDAIDNIVFKFGIDVSQYGEVEDDAPRPTKLKDKMVKEARKIRKKEVNFDRPTKPKFGESPFLDALEEIDEEY